MNKAMMYFNCLFLMMVIFWTGCSDAETEQSPTNAVEFAAVEELYRQAKQGNADAMTELAECYEKGLGVAQSADEAAAWRAKAERAKAEEK